MKQDFDIRAGDESSMDMYYSGNDQDYHCVGHIRGDFGKSGDEYWATFWEHEGINVAGEGCKEELTALVNTLRTDPEHEETERHCCGLSEIEEWEPLSFCSVRAAGHLRGNRLRHAR